MAIGITSEATKEVDLYLQEWSGMRSERVDFDRKWQYVSDYILPRRDFSIVQRPNALRPHRVTSSVATNANARMAALTLAYTFDPTRPFLLPNVKRGLAVAGRATDLSNVSEDYLDATTWDIFSHMSLERARLMLRFNSMLKEFCAFGNGVIWTGRKRGFGPYYQTRPVQACWWSENEEGEIDTLYFKMVLPIWRVLQRWPKAAEIPTWNQYGDKRSNLETTSVVIACRPRAGGVKGAVGVAKPFAWIVIADEKGAILEKSGFDSFPYAVFRYDVAPGNAYAEGPGCQVLPDVMVLNHLQQAIENAASQKAMPPLAMPARMFSKMLDRRAGAANYYNPAGLGLNRADQAIIKLDFTGDIQDAVALKKSLTDDIELGYFVDWLRLRESGDMTAEEVTERRDIRLRGMASIVANLGAPFSVLGDRTLEIMDAENMLAPAPAQLAKVEVDWEYAGPLAVAQLRGSVQGTLQLIQARGLIAQQDPAAAEVVNLEESLRVIAEGLAVPPRVTNSRVHVEQTRQAMLAKQQQDAAVQRAQALAAAGKDAGAGADSLASAAGQGAPPEGGMAPGPAGAPPAPFAPVAPLVQPLAA